MNIPKEVIHLERIWSFNAVSTVTPENFSATCLVTVADGFVASEVRRVTHCNSCVLTLV